MKLCVICDYNVCLPACLSVEERAERKREINPDSVIECFHPSSETEEFANLSLLVYVTPLAGVCVHTLILSLSLSLSLPVSMCYRKCCHGDGDHCSSMFCVCVLVGFFLSSSHNHYSHSLCLICH